MNPLLKSTLVASGMLLACAIELRSQEDGSRTVRVEFDAGTGGKAVEDRITGREFVVFKLNAREKQFLKVRLVPDNESVDFNIYIPGRGPGDEALYTSALGGREYVGQLYATGDHSISVFLNRAAARRGESAKFTIEFSVTDQAPGSDADSGGGGRPGGTGPATEMDAAWEKVEIAPREHAPLLERQANLPRERSARPWALALAVLEPDFAGLVTSVEVDYDRMENPAEAEVTVTERGILDDDLLGIRHVVSLARNSNDEWRLVGYRVGELRRRHLR